MNKSPGDNLIDYITYHLTYRKAKKSNRFYKSLVRLYAYYPDMVYEFIDNVNELGYYKDLIHILCKSSYDKLNDYIYNKIMMIIRKDLACLSRNENISTMGKWLPKEKSSTDKKSGFVKIFCKLFFGSASTHNLKRYRLLKTNLNKHLGTLECKMCSKEYDTIDFEKVGINSLVHNMNALSKHPNLKNKITESLKTKDYKLPIFIEKIIKGRIPKKVANKIFEMYNFMEKIPIYERLMSINKCIINMSSSMFNKKAHYLAIGICLELKRLHNDVEILSINGNRLWPVRFNNNKLCDNINTLLSHCSVADTKTITIPDNNNTLVISDEKIKGDNIIQLNQIDNANVNIICGELKDQYKITNVKNDTVKDIFDKYQMQKLIVITIRWIVILCFGLILLRT